MTGARRLIPLVPVVLLVSLVVPSVASARALSPDERQGQGVIRAVRSGDRDCGDLSREDFVVAGEYAMGQRFPTARAHESMDELMGEMMGRRGEEQMHEYLGRQATGCGGGRVPASFGTMMGGMVGMMGGERGSMMGLRGDRSGAHDDDWSGAAVVMVALMVLLIAAVAVVAWRWRPQSGGGRSAATPLDVLGQRFARGEIDADEYRRRRDALRGAT